MPILRFDYDDFRVLCDQLLDRVAPAPRRDLRQFGSCISQHRFRGRWFHTSGSAAAPCRTGLRRRLGFPRGSSCA